MEDTPIQALTSNQRRVAGVLIEKAKTTPDVYPMTLNSIRNACNQKSNRAPVMDLAEERVEDTLYELRKIGTVIEVQSGGRVAKFKHELYEWLGIEKAELAVIAELLLRGEQTLGDLRARSSRMESSLKGIGDLVPVVNGLIAKGLIIELTPKGRGQIVTHNLYLDNEVERMKQTYPELSRNPICDRDATSLLESANPESTSATSETPAANLLVSAVPSEETTTANDDLFRAVEELKQQVADLQKEVAELRSLLE